jgi:hypothetical protein
METMNSDPHNTKYHTWSDTHLSTCQVNSTHPWNRGEIAYLRNTSNTLHVSISDALVKDEFLGYTYNDEGFDYPYLAFGNPRPCKVLSSNPKKNTFDVAIFFLPHQIPQEYRKEDLRGVVCVFGLPRNDIQYMTKPLKWDWHDPMAFRHEIHFPDDKFPNLWRDLE